MASIAGIPRIVLSNWSNNHRHHGGIPAVLHCILGTVRIALLPPKPTTPGMDILTFSVIPGLSQTWVLLTNHALGGQPRITVGDCSGGLVSYRSLPPWTAVVPILNYQHGRKLDLFISRVCCGEYILLSDDDVFWLGNEPIEWALEQFAQDPKVAAVSLVPRGGNPWVIDGVEHQPMGSYGLMIRRQIILNEGISFLPVQKPSPDPTELGQKYDTGDFLNVELIRRGYRIPIAPLSLREKVLVSKGISRAILRVLDDQPVSLTSFSDGLSKIIYAVSFVRGLERIRRSCLHLELPIITADKLDRAYERACALMPEEAIEKAQQSADTLIGRLIVRLKTTDAPGRIC